MEASQASTPLPRNRGEGKKKLEFTPSLPWGRGCPKGGRGGDTDGKGLPCHLDFVEDVLSADYG